MITARAVFAMGASDLKGTETMKLARIRGAQMRVAMVSMHTSPLDQPGTGDAGGLNVYVAQTARRLAEAGAEVDVFTRATSSRQPEVVPLAPGVRVFNLAAGPYEGLRKEDLPSQVCAFTSELLRVAAGRPEGFYDIVHSHYWLSGQAAWLASERWGIPLVHTMHTMAKVKNGALAESDTLEPLSRVIGEEQLVAVADRLIANTADEKDELVRLYGADPVDVAVVHPGVDLAVFHPGSRAAARRRLGLPARRTIALFVGRIQPLKAPDLLVRSVAALVADQPDRREQMHVVIAGGLSGSGLARPDELAKLAADLGVADLVDFVPPSSPDVLADYYRSADFTVVPSHSESFGLVALESQASGTPVIAAGVGGLRTSVDDSVSGLLVPDHDVDSWAGAIARLMDEPALRRQLAEGAVRHAGKFSWSATAAGTLEVYRNALHERRSRVLAAVN
jgi:D-inositol-3-phosphate glycosyltransferase